MLSSKAPSGAATNGSCCPETRRKAQLGHRTTMICDSSSVQGCEHYRTQTSSWTWHRCGPGPVCTMPRAPVTTSVHTALGDGVWAATVRLLVTSRIAALPGGWTRPCMHHAMHTCDHVLSHRYRWWRSYCVLCAPELSASSWTGCISAGGGGGQKGKEECKHTNKHTETPNCTSTPHTQ
jgi:hypothetical protein